MRLAKDNIFSVAVSRMYKDGDFDRKYKHNRRVRRIKKSIEGMGEMFGGIDQIPSLVLLMTMKDTELLQNAIIYMMLGAAEGGGAE